MMQVSRTSNGFSVTATAAVTVVFTTDPFDNDRPAVEIWCEALLLHTPIEIISCDNRGYLARLAYQHARDWAREPRVW